MLFAVRVTAMREMSVLEHLIMEGHGQMVRLAVDTVSRPVLEQSETRICWSMAPSFLDSICIRFGSAGPTAGIDGIVIAINTPGADTRNPWEVDIWKYGAAVRQAVFMNTLNFSFTIDVLVVHTAVPYMPLIREILSGSKTRDSRLLRQAIKEATDEQIKRLLP